MGSSRSDEHVVTEESHLSDFLKYITCIITNVNCIVVKDT